MRGNDGGAVGGTEAAAASGVVRAGVGKEARSSRMCPVVAAARIPHRSTSARVTVLEVSACKGKGWGCPVRRPREAELGFTAYRRTTGGNPGEPAPSPPALAVFKPRFFGNGSI